MKCQVLSFLTFLYTATAAGVRHSHFTPDEKKASNGVLYHARTTRGCSIAAPGNRRLSATMDDAAAFATSMGLRECLNVVITDDNYEDFLDDDRDGGMVYSLGSPGAFTCAHLMENGDDYVDFSVWSPSFQRSDFDKDGIDLTYDGSTTSSDDMDEPQWLYHYDYSLDWNDYDESIRYITHHGPIMNPTKTELKASIYDLTLGVTSPAPAYSGSTIDIRCWCGAYTQTESTEEPCFSGETTVDVLGKGPIKMSEVSVGDKVMTSSNTYEPLLGFTHKETGKAGAFIQLYADGIDAPLEVTGNHLVYTEGKAAPVPAESLKEGDKLVGLSGAHEILKIEQVTREGLYTPMTSSGDIIVNGLRASNYVMLQKGSEYAVFKNGMSTGISQHSGIHMFASPFRMMCKAGFSSVCSVEDGYLSWVEQGIKFAKYADTLNTIPQMFLLVAALAIFAPIYALEMAGVALPLLAIGAIALRRAGVSAKVKTA